jgi:hypothetical protein
MIDLLILWVFLGNISLKILHTLNKSFIFILTSILIEYRCRQINIIVILYFHHGIIFFSHFELFKFFDDLRLSRLRCFLICHARYRRSIPIYQLKSCIILFILSEWFWIIVINVLLYERRYLFRFLIMALNTWNYLLRRCILLVNYFIFEVFYFELFCDLCFLFKEGLFFL